MLYQPLKYQIIQLGPKEERELDAGAGVVLAPQSSCKVFIHWLTESGKIRQTYTMTYPTRIEGKVKLINGQATAVSINAIQIG